MTCIDINCDMGEFPEAVADGTQESLMPHLTSVNIACGGHAGNRDTMRTTIAQAVSYKLALGAHPGYPDPANFGRVELDIPLSKVADGVARQVAELASIASESGARLTHVKPHGALYNQAAKNRKLAGADRRRCSPGRSPSHSDGSGRIAHAGRVPRCRVRRGGGSFRRQNVPTRWEPSSPALFRRLDSRPATGGRPGFADRSIGTGDRFRWLRYGDRRPDDLHPRGHSGRTLNCRSGCEGVGQPRRETGANPGD